MKKTIILFNPPLYFSQGKPYSLDVSVPPLGLLYLASYVNKYSSEIKAEVVDITPPGCSLDDIQEMIVIKKPFAIGITSMTPQLQGAMELAEFIKKNFKKGPKIFIGGPHISADPDFINRFGKIFDYAITGEAEKTFLNSLEKLLNGEKIPRIQAGEVIMGLNTIPFPNRHLIDRNKYSEHESMMYSRGCPYHCYYCSRPSISKIVRYRSARNMVDEIKLAYKDCHSKIDFQDDTFNLNKKRVLEFCEAVQKEGLKLEWRCNARIDLIDEELLCTMKEAGCSLIHFGIESGNERIRKEIVNKGQFTNKQIYKVFNWCKKYKIKVAGYFMIGHPEETKKDLEDTKEMILNSGIDLLGLSIPTPFPGSELYEIAKKKGIINEEIIDKFTRKELGEGYVGNYPVFISEKVSREDVYALMKEINRKFYINFRTLFKKLKGDFLSPKKLYIDVKDLFALILKGVSSRKPYVIKK